MRQINPPAGRVVVDSKSVTEHLQDDFLQIVTDAFVFFRSVVYHKPFDITSIYVIMQNTLISPDGGRLSWGMVL